MVNIGVGHPEEVCRVIYEGGLFDDVEFCSETGVVGGLPAPGVYFGSAINPRRIGTSAELFHEMDERLGVTIAGILQVDEHGNVNVSRRGPRLTDYVGPGGLPDLCRAAKKILFIGSWMTGARVAVRGDRIQLTRGGAPKFVRQVDEVTFSGPEALKRGKQVYYVTHVGCFHLTSRGMELVAVMHGVDVRRDILNVSPMAIVIPEGDGPRVLDSSLVSGKGFQLRWGNNVGAES
jgi:propionate CoA-transferase